MKPNAYGGLGIKDSKTTDDAFLMNQAWRTWQNTHSLLAKFLCQKHYQTTNFLQTTSHTGSHSWKALLRGRNLLQGGLRWIIRNGCKINFWMDNGCLRDQSEVSFIAYYFLTSIRLR